MRISQPFWLCVLAALTHRDSLRSWLKVSLTAKTNIAQRTGQGSGNVARLAWLRKEVGLSPFRGRGLRLTCLSACLSACLADCRVCNPCSVSSWPLCQYLCVIHNCMHDIDALTEEQQSNCAAVSGFSLHQVNMKQMQTPLTFPSLFPEEFPVPSPLSLCILIECWEIVMKLANNEQCIVMRLQLAIRNASRLDVATLRQSTGSPNLISVSNVLRKTFVPQKEDRKWAMQWRRRSCAGRAEDKGRGGHL